MNIAAGQSQKEPLSAVLRKLRQEQQVLGADLAAAEKGEGDLTGIEARLDMLRKEYRAFEQAKAQSYQGLGQAFDSHSANGSLALRRELLSEFGDDLAGLLTMALRDENRRLRLEAAEILGEIKPNDVAPRLVLLEAIKEDLLDSGPVHSLSEISRGHSTIQTLIQLLDNENERVRAGILSVFAEQRCCFSPEITIPAAMRALKDPSAAVRHRAAYALLRGSLHAESAIPSLVEALKDSSPDVRRFCAKALGEIGPRAAEALPVLQELMISDMDLDARSEMRRSAKKIAESANGRTAP